MKDQAGTTGGGFWPDVDAGRALQRFRTLVETVDDGIYQLDDDDRFVAANDGFVELTGYAPDELRGEHISVLFDEADRRRIDSELSRRRTADDPRSEPFELTVRTADGGAIPCEFRVNLLVDDGEIRGSVGIVRDSSEREGMEDELRATKERYQRLVEQNLLGIYIVQDGEIEYVNPRFAEIFGYTPEEMLSETEPLDHVAPEDRETVAEHLRARQDGDEDAIHYTFTGVRKDGERIELEVHGGRIEYRGEPAVLGTLIDVTDRERMESELRRERNLKDQIVETSPVGIAVVDADGELAFANERAEEIYGRSREEIAEFSHDDPRWDLVDENGEALDAGEAPFDRVVTSEEPIYDQVIGLRRPSGERVWVSVNGAPQWDEHGDLERAVFAFEDITEHRDLEAELDEILGRVTDAFYALDDEFRFTHVNERAEELLQSSEAELLGEELWELFPDAAEIDDVRAAFDEAMETQEPRSFETYFEPLEFWVEATVYPSETGVSVYFRDITEQVERERELERALDLLEKTERIADVGGWEIDVETQEVFWTDHIFELLEVDADEEPPLEEALAMYHEEDQPLVEDAVEDALESGDPFDVEVRLRTAATGEVRWLRLQGVPETVDGEVVSFRGAAQDVTERKQREQRLEELINRLEESNERLEQFAYAASHDLQEPLRMVSSYLQLLEQRYADELDEDAEEFLEFAVDGADRMREMIEGLLQYSRVETHGEPFEPVDLAEVLGDVRDDLQVKIEEHNAEITAEELPRVVGDGGQLRQVFQNLLDNAIEYSGDAPPRVHVAAERRSTVDDEWVVSVSDEGIGIDPSNADRIFEVFESLHAPDEHTGTGIGLALCERIVERHGGEIWVDSESGAGTTVSFTLPAAGDRDD